MSDEEVLELFELHTGAAFETSLQEEHWVGKDGVLSFARAVLQVGRRSETIEKKGRGE